MPVKRYLPAICILVVGFSLPYLILSLLSPEGGPPMRTVSSLPVAVLTNLIPFGWLSFQVGTYRDPYLKKITREFGSISLFFEFVALVVISALALRSNFRDAIETSSPFGNLGFFVAPIGAIVVMAMTFIIAQFIGQMVAGYRGSSWSPQRNLESTFDIPMRLHVGITHVLSVLLLAGTVAAEGQQSTVSIQNRSMPLDQLGGFELQNLAISLSAEGAFVVPTVPT